MSFWEESRGTLVFVGSVWADPSGRLGVCPGGWGKLKEDRLSKFHFHVELYFKGNSPTVCLVEAPGTVIGIELADCSPSLSCGEEFSDDGDPVAPAEGGDSEDRG